MGDAVVVAVVVLGGAFVHVFHACAPNVYLELLVITHLKHLSLVSSLGT